MHGDRRAPAMRGDLDRYLESRRRSGSTPAHDVDTVAQQLLEEHGPIASRRIAAALCRLAQ